MNANRTAGRQRRPDRVLTEAQLGAIDLLADGKTNKETADLLNLSRTRIARWRLFDPVFQAALNRRRAEVWGASIDRLRSLTLKALDALAEELENKGSPHRLKAAGEILRLARLPSASSRIGPTDAEEIVRGIVVERREKTPSRLDHLFDDGKDLPPLAKHLEDTWRELEARSAEPDETAP
jgi:hypothetical protein